MAVIDNMRTGFEPKPLFVVIRNWLYTKDLDTRVAAAIEMRKRFLKMVPKPAWMED